MNNEYAKDDYVLTPLEKEKALSFLKLFNIEGKPGSEVATEGQIKIFHSIVFRPKLRVQIMASTQYGKSLFVALACIIVACIQDEIVSVVAPTADKAKIIMRYFIDHLGDNELFTVTLTANTKLDRLRQEESKDRIILRTGGGIFVVSAQSANSRRTLESAMGLGSKVVIQDESCLIPDQTEATVFRMIAGKGENAFYCKIGNPFYRVTPYTHFYQTWNDTAYSHIFIDYIQGIAEGRYTRDFIEEARKKPLFSVLFENKFPAPDQMIEGGYSPLLTDEEVRNAFVTEENGFGFRRLAADVAGGGRNFSTMVLRYYNVAKILYKSHEPDTMLFTGNVLRYADNYKVKDVDISVDGVGIGRGAADRMREQRRDIVMVIGNDPPSNPDAKQFINLRAEMYWRAREWILNGGKLEADDDWLQLSQMKWKVTDSNGTIKMQSKEEMLKDGIESPDIADAFAMTFARTDPESQYQEEERVIAPEPVNDPYA